MSGFPRPAKHWTPRYVADRTASWLWQRRHPDAPWINRHGVSAIERRLAPDARCLEWGSGRSTSWLAARTAHVHSVEHDAAWGAKVAAMTAALANVELHVPGAERDAYVAAGVTAGPRDVVLIDGIHRDDCALAALDLVVPGGVVVIDNVERYLPSRSRAPEAIGDAYETDAWRAFADRTRTWIREWTSDGVTDCVLITRPEDDAG